MTLRSLVSILGLGLAVPLVATGCDPAAPRSAAEPHTPDGRPCPSGGCDAAFSTVEPRFTTSAVDPEACAQVEQEAQALLDGAPSCASDMACGVVLAADIVEDPCVPVFQCYLPVAPGFPTDEFRERAADLDRRYRAACGACPDATCVEQDLMLSVCDAGSCELDVASVPMNTTAAP